MSENKLETMKIVVDDGVRRVPIMNVEGEEIGYFQFRPTDLGIIERFNGMADKFGWIVEPLSSIDDEQTEDDVNYSAALTEATNRLNAAVNELFGGDMAGAFFGKMNPFSPVDGVFYCQRALEAVGKFINDQFSAETAKLERRVAKYTKATKSGKK